VLFVLTSSSRKEVWQKRLMSVNSSMLSQV